MDRSCDPRSENTPSPTPSAAEQLKLQLHRTAFSKLFEQRTRESLGQFRKLHGRAGKCRRGRAPDIYVLSAVVQAQERGVQIFDKIVGMFQTTMKPDVRVIMV